MSKDITEQPYAEFMEKVLSDLNEMEPDAIVVMAIEPGKGMMFSGRNVGFEDYAQFAAACQAKATQELMEHEKLKQLSSLADLFSGLSERLNNEEEDEDEEDEDEEDEDEEDEEK